MEINNNNHLLKLIIYLFFLSISVIFTAVPFVAIYSVYQIYHASSVSIDDFEQLENKAIGDEFWIQLEISESNIDTLGFAAYSIYDDYNHRSYLWQRQNIRNYFPDTIYVNSKDKKDIPLLLEVDIYSNKMEVLSVYEAPIIGHFTFNKRWFSREDLTKKNENRIVKRIEGLKEKDLLTCRVNILSKEHLILSTQNPYWVGEPSKIWDSYFSDDFIVMSLVISSLFFLVFIAVFINFIRSKLRSNIN